MPTSMTSPPFRVLLVDDDPGIRALLGMALASEGWVIRMAHDGREALEAVRQNEPFDLIICDLQMPVLDGRATVRQIRAEGFSASVLILSAYGARAAQEELGVEAWMDKPFDPCVLADQVRKLIMAKRSPSAE